MLEYKEEKEAITQKALRCADLAMVKLSEQVNKGNQKAIFRAIEFYIDLRNMEELKQLEKAINELKEMPD